MTTKTDTITLPPFPDTITKLPIDHDGNGPLVWKDDEVRAYARAAVEADRQSQPAISDMQLHCILQVYDDALDKAREGRVFDNPGRPGSLEARAWDAGTQRGKELGPITQPAASAEPVEINIDRVLSIADAHANESREDGVRLLDRGGLFAFAQDVLRVAVPVAAQPSVPEGWKMVPVEPSIAMCIRGAHVSDQAVNGHAAAQVYAAMLNAAPTPPAVEQAVHDVLSDVVTRGIGIMRIDPTQIYQHTPPAVEPTITVTESGGVQLNTSSPEVINKLWALVDQFRIVRKEQP